MKSFNNFCSFSIFFSAITTIINLCKEVDANIMWCSDGTFAGVYLDNGSFLGCDSTQPELDNIYYATNWLASKIYNEGEFDLVAWVQEEGDDLDWVRWPELPVQQTTPLEPWEVYSNLSEALGFEA